MGDLVDFTSLGPDVLTKLGEDFVRALSVPNPMLFWSKGEKDCVDRISKVVSRARKSPMDLSSRDATLLAETFHEVCLHNQVSPRHLKPSGGQAISLEFTGSPEWCPLFRLYAHALLHGSHIFPGIELLNESPDYEPRGFMDVWRGNYHGRQVCVKSIRIRNTTHLKEIKKVRGSFFNQSYILSTLHTRSIAMKLKGASTFPIRTYSPSLRLRGHCFRSVS